MKQVTRCEFGGGLSEVSLNRLIIKLIKKNIRTPSESLKEGTLSSPFFFYAYNNSTTFTLKQSLLYHYHPLPNGRARM